MLPLRFETYRGGLAASVAGNVLSQIAGFFALLVFAREFGQQQQADVYLYAAATLSAVALLITSLNGSVLIPEFMRLATQEGPPKAMAFANAFLRVYGVVGGLLGALVFMFPAAFLDHASRFENVDLALGVQIVMLVAPLLPGEMISTTLADLLASQRFFSVQSISLFATRAIQLASLFLLHDRFGVRAMAIGSLAATTLQIVVLAAVMRRRLGWNLRADFRLFRPALFRNAGLSLAGNAVSSLVALIPQYLLSGLSTGWVAASNYANRVVNLPQTFLLNPASSITGLKLNDLQARGDTDGLAQTFTRASRGLVFLLAPTAAFFFAEAPAMIHLLFERGSFDSRAVAEASIFMRYLSLLLPLLAIETIVTRALLAAQMIGAMVRFQIAQGVWSVILMAIGFHVAGVQGYLLAYLAFHVWTMIILLPIMRRWFPAIRFGQTLSTLVLMFTLSAACAWASHVIVSYGPPRQELAALILKALVMGLPLVLINQRYRLNEDLAHLIERPFQRWMRRPRES